MKKLRWSDLSLVSKIVIEVGVLVYDQHAVLCPDQQFHAGDG